MTVLETAWELSLSPPPLRIIICRALRVRPDPGNWSEYPNVWDEVQGLMYGCEWFKVYDIIEVMHGRCCTALAESEIRLWWWPRYVRA